MIDYLHTINELYNLTIDNKTYDSDFVISKNKKDRLGFETYLNIRNLSEGKHTVTIIGPQKKGSKGKTTQ